MTKNHKQISYAALFMTDEPWVPAWTIFSSARRVREAVGRQWSKDDPKEGWKAAKIESGVRVVKIELRVIR